MTFHVPDSWRVFVLDDTQERLDWFRSRLPEMKCAKTAEAALEILSSEKFDLVFLDHDLCWEDAAYPERQHGNGKEIARYLARTNFPGRVVIHSKNELGVAAMKKTLPGSCIARFDEFEIITTVSAAR